MSVAAGRPHVAVPAAVIDAPAEAVVQALQLELLRRRAPPAA